MARAAAVSVIAILIHVVIAGPLNIWIQVGFRAWRTAHPSQ
jgi:hypothetical protein